MAKKNIRDKYLKHYASLLPLEKSSLGLTIVIPAYAEHEHLPETLDALDALEKVEQCRVIVVVNHGPDAPEEAKKSNDKVWEELQRRAGQQRYNLQALDCRAKGEFLTRSKTGVGLARKIGMDSALAAFTGPEEEGVLVCLDADCLVSENYITELLNWTKDQPKQGTVNIPYEHRLPEDPEHRLAIVTYELFLRYYVGGLKAYGNPYGHHSMGSAFAVRHRTYCSVRGMVKRRAAEDFYFLDKVSKVSEIGTLNDARVFPSARISERVIFGTGRTMLKAQEGDKLAVFYDLRTFSLMSQLRQLLRDAKDQEITDLGVHLGIDWNSYLAGRGWLKARRGLFQEINGVKTARPSFDHWFDGLETLKLAHFIRDELYPPQSAEEVLPGFAEMLGQNPDCKSLEAWLLWARRAVP